MKSLIAGAVLCATTSAWATTHYVFVSDDVFDPAFIEIEEGDRVRFIFDGPSDHSATAAAGQVDFFDSGVQAPGVFFEHTFSVAGTVNYYCTLQGSDDGGGLVSGMSGTIEVVVPAIDTDGDGLSDDDELLVHGTDPNVADTDGGGVDDGDELDNGTDPLDGSDDLPPFVLSGPTSLTLGANTEFTVTGAPPIGTVVFFRSDDLSATTPIPGCPGLEADFVVTQVLDQGRADTYGERTISKFLPASAAGTWHFQALDYDNCRLSNLETATF